MTTLVSMLDRARTLYKNNLAIVDEEGSLNWGAFVNRVTRAAGVLAKMGLKKGDRYGIISTNSFRQAELIYGGYWGGYIPVPINYRLAAKEIAFILEDAEATFLIIEENFREILDVEDLAAFRSRCLYLPSGPNPDVLSTYEGFLKQCDPASPQELAEDDLAILIYTGGTTGRSKGVRLTHRNIITNAMQLAIALKINSADIYLHVAPMFHSADFIGTGFSMLGAAHSYLAAPTPKSILEALAATRATILMLPPTLIIGILQEPDLPEYDISRLRCIFYGSAPMAAEWISRTLEAFPNAELVQGFGLTETAPILTTLGNREHRMALKGERQELLKSVGRPVAGLDLKIVDDEGKDAAQGVSGEIVVRGGNVTRGYLNLPELTRQTIRGGWFHTGDIGRLDEHGYLFLLDRKKDMIITGGENVYCSEVEAALYQHPRVHEAAVFGVPDKKFGEAVFAVIVPKPGTSITKDEIVEHCRDRIGGYKIPRKMAFVETLPKSALGKILKTELRKEYGGR